MTNSSDVEDSLSAATGEAEQTQQRRYESLWRSLLRDPLALMSAIWLLLMMIFMVIGPMLFEAEATKINLRARQLPPGTLDAGWINVLGSDSLGRSMLARLVVAARTTLTIALGAVLTAMVIGGVLGAIAGYRGGFVGHLIMRIADVLQSFPSLLLAVVILYVFEPGVLNLVVVLAITRAPVYIRTTRAEVLEIRERVFVDASRALGGASGHILRWHIGPLVAPTLLTIMTIDFAVVMLAESGLSFLGIGIQPPEVTWGLMVAQGRNYLSQAWWLSFFPGLAIMLAALTANTLSNWLRMATDPTERWRLGSQKQSNE